MPDYYVSNEAARKALDKAWTDIKTTDEPPEKMKKYIEEVLEASDVTYKYILVTGFLAKYINPNIHARSLQKGSSLEGAYDARSLAHGVVVGFEKAKGNLFGLSNEPFVNKPARHTEHDKDNQQLRNRVIARSTHQALEKAQEGPKSEVYRGLVHILRIGAKNAKNEKQVEIKTSCNMDCVTDFISKFLEHADGGARLVAVWGAFTSLLSESAKVKTNSPNAADRFAKTSGDVEVWYDKTLVSATECKQRPINHDDVKHGIKKAIENGVPEYLFVISSGIADGDKEKISETLEKASKHIDTKLINIHSKAHRYALILNPFRRAKFGLEVVRLLRDMRKYESANVAAELWNKITREKDSVSKSE